MNKCRLLLWKDCDRRCKGCCNRQFDLDSLPEFSTYDYNRFDEIYFTGGEPMLYPNTLLNILRHFRIKSKSKLFLYTAKVEKIDFLCKILLYLDGITVSLHDEKDVWDFYLFDSSLNLLSAFDIVLQELSFRLNVFKNIEVDYFRINKIWYVKKDIEWINPCPLPLNETFMKFPYVSKNVGSI